MALSEASFTQQGFGGELLFPGDPRYDEARSLHNAIVDTKPALFARCTSADDVVAAIAVAQREGLPFSIRGGGHAITGSALVEGGITIDTRGMQAATVDPATNIIRAEAGLSWGPFDAAAWEQGLAASGGRYGLAVTGGRVPTTGIVGLALGSGSGWLERTFGYTCDNLVKVEMVTADGRQVVASATENPELFWGLRGGGGNFGVITALHLQLHELPPQILGGRLVYPVTDAVELIRFYRDFMDNAPDQVNSGLAYLTAPNLPHIPAEMRGQPAIGIVCCYAGPPEEGMEAFRPLLEFRPPTVNTLAPMTYPEVQQVIVPGHPHGLYHFWSADFLTELSDETIDVFVEQSSRQVSPRGQMLIIPIGGAIARTPEDAMAFGHRSTRWSTHYQTMWEDPADNEANIEYTRTISAALKPWTSGGAYLNYLSNEGVARIEASFGAEKFARLRQLKKEWDPTNFFNKNQNIPPAT